MSPNPALLTWPYASGAVVSSAYIGTVSDTANRTSYTFSDVPFGPDGSDRHIVVFAVGSTSATSSVSSMTIGGLPATVDGAVDSRMAIMAGRAAPTGTSGTVVVTFGGAQMNAAIYIWALTAPAVDAVSVERRVMYSAQTFNMSNPVGGVTLFAARTSTIDPATTYTGAGALDFSGLVEGGGQCAGRVLTPGAFQFTTSTMSGANYGALAVTYEGVLV